MDSTNGAHSHGGESHSSFFAQRGAVDDAPTKAPGAPAPLRSTNTRPVSAESAQDPRVMYADEMNRIIKSCFDKKDERGLLLQTYITHVRVEEDGAHPSSPPPPDASQQYKKPRVVILAVKLSGRVWMHKARENADTTFQIGKSWPLDELRAIETFSIPIASTPEQQQRAQWATPSGFIISMAKPYFWKAKTTKEKEYFIKVLVKVYGKYTSGNTPQLLGFEEKVKRFLEGTAHGAASDGRLSQPDSPQQPAPLQTQDKRLQQARPPIDNSSNQELRSESVNSADTRLPPSPLRQGPTVNNVQHQQQSRQLSSQEQVLQPAHQLQVNQQRGVATQVQARPTQDLRPTPSREQLRTELFLSPEPAPPLRTTLQLSNSNLAERPAITPVKPTLIPLPAPSGPTNQSNPHSLVDNSSTGQVDSTITTTTTQRWRPEGLTVATGNGTIRGPDTIRSHDGPPGTLSKQDSSAFNASKHFVPERRRPPLESTLNDQPRSYRSDVSRSSPKPLITRFPPPGDDHVIGERQPLLPPVPGVTISGAYVSPVPTPAPSAQDENSAKREEEVGLVPSQPVADQKLGIVPSESQSSHDIQVQDANGVDEESTPPGDAEADQKYRPGLGPMMGKKPGEAATKLRKATTAYSAFKPRAGGAGERLLKTKTSMDSDGLIKVIPAPSLPRDTSQDIMKPPPIDTNLLDKPSTPIPSEITLPIHDPDVQTPAAATGLALDHTPTDAPQVGALENISINEVAPLVPQRLELPRDTVKAKRKSNAFAKSLSAMDIDPFILDGREVEYEAILDDFGWEQNLHQAKQIDSLETSLRREIGRLAAGSWLGSSDQKDERIELVEKLLDKAIAECDEMEGLLTLYGIELSTLNDDIAYIETQSQGLQVQTANQRLLQTELQSLVNTISIGNNQLEPLRKASLRDTEGLEAIESSLLMLYRALQTIDPSLIKHGDSVVSSSAFGDQSLAKMRVLKEKRQLYLSESQEFLTRMKNYAEPTFAMAFQRTKEITGRNGAFAKLPTTREASVHDAARNYLWQYSPLMLFAKEIDPAAWTDMVVAYQGQARSIYQDEFRDNMMTWKKAARKPATDEQDSLFTAQEKENEGLTSTARKLTVKRSQTLAKTLRSGSLEKRLGLDKGQESRNYPFETFTGVLEETVSLIFTEQNFVVDFFHATTLDSMDFVDTVTAARPSERRGRSILGRKPAEPDRAMARKVLDVMQATFITWPNEMQSLVDWATNQDSLQCVGILCALERKRVELEDTNQEFVIRTLQRLYEHCAKSFTQFIDSQIRAIEDTKVKIKKRKGVITFIRVFPNFSSLLESMLPAADGTERLETRTFVDDAYTRVNKAMFDSLKVIAKESPAGQVYGAAADPEDKEALNYHILLIENMYHYYTEVDEHGDAVLGQWRGKAMLEMSEHQESYVSAVIRRPLGKLLDFLESTENVQTTSAGRNALGRVPNTNQGHSKSAFKKVLASYDGKEVRRGIDTLKRRIEKHFGEADDPAISQKLIAQILGECERRYNDVLDRTHSIAGEFYEGGVEVEFHKVDISQAFRR